MWCQERIPAPGNTLRPKSKIYISYQDNPRTLGFIVLTTASGVIFKYARNLIYTWLNMLNNKLLERWLTIRKVLGRILATDHLD